MRPWAAFCALAGLFGADALISQAQEISRGVRVTTRTDALFAKGMVAKGTIDLSGNNVRSDSFDSGDPAFSTGGKYDEHKFKDNGDVATNSGLVNSLNVGNADIYGHVSTGPGGSISVGANGAVGSTSWITSGNNGIQTGYSSDDMNVQFPEVKVPFTSSFPVPSGSPLVIPFSGNWRLDGDLTRPLIIRSNVQANLLITGNINLAGSTDRIEIQPGASLRLYMAGEKASIQGQGVVNGAGNATNFYYFGLPSNTQLSLGGNGAFVGAIYAPSAAFSLGGGGNDAQDFIGASITGSVRMNGHFNFHYDENLARVGPNRMYLINSWNEVAPSTLAVPR